MEALKIQFRPEFLNRIDEIVIFNSLGKEEIKRIVEIQLRYLQQRLTEKKISISFSDKIKDLIADKGFDPIFGARPIKRTIQQMIENPLSIKILNGDFVENDIIKTDVKNGVIIFKK